MAVWDSAEQAAASPFPHRDEPLVKFPIALRAVMGALLLLAASGGAVSAATTTVECGLFHDYVAPDPVAVTTGSSGWRSPSRISETAPSETPTRTVTGWASPSRSTQITRSLPLT